MDQLIEKFEKMGARLKVRDNLPRFAQRGSQIIENLGSARLNVLSDKNGEYFDIRMIGNPQLQILDVQPKDRHLLLMVKDDNSKAKFLCGHDERHWFVAAIPEMAPVGTVRQAKEALKPPQVQARQVGLKAKDRNRRKNDAYIRQGEWFFLPANINPDPKLILKNEPLSRGTGSKPHMMEFCYRAGGTTVYVCSQYPQGIKQDDYNKLLKSDPSMRSRGWRVMVKDAKVYAKGRITHADHATIELKSWCEVQMNTENKAQAMRHVAFLD